MRRVFGVLLTVSFVLFMLAGCGMPQSKEEKYPAKQLVAVVPFGAGGSTDIMARGIAPLAEEHLKQAVVVKNVAGGNGSIGAKEVIDKNADGYTILVTAENLGSYKVMGVSQLSFDNYDPVILLARAVPVIVTRPDEKWSTIRALIKQANDNPGRIKMATTGPTGISGIVSTLLEAKFNMVPFKSEGEIITALLGGHVDVASVGLLSVADYIKTGKLKVVAAVNDKKLPAHPEWAALGEEMPEYNKNLPWGPFYGVWVKKGTPESVISTLQGAFSKAADDPRFKEFIVKSEMLPMNLKGQEARNYVNEFTSKTSWLLYEGGATKKSPEEIGIPKRK